LASDINRRAVRVTAAKRLPPAADIVAVTVFEAVEIALTVVSPRSAM